MDKEALSKRLLHLDIVKVVALAIMPFIHVFEEIPLYNLYSSSFPMEAMRITFALLYDICPTVFVFCLGCGIVLQRNNSAKNLARRGLFFFCLEAALNMVRYFVPYVVGAIARPDPNWFFNFLVSFSYSDILLFASLAYFSFALFKALKCNCIVIGVVGTALAVASYLIPGPITCGNNIGDALIGSFIYSNEMSFFPLMTWLIFPIAGYHYQTRMLKVKRQNLYHGILWGITASLGLIAFIIYKVTGFMQPRFFLWGEYGTNMDLPTLSLVLPFVIGWICLAFFLTKLVGKRFAAFITESSRNVMLIYIFHWPMITYIELIFIGVDAKLNTPILVFVFGVIYLAISMFLAHLCRKKLDSTDRMKWFYRKWIIEDKPENKENKIPA